MEFKDKIKLDINHLDRNAIDQVEYYEEYSRLWADAITDRDQLKERLSVVKAEVDEMIRAKPSKYGWANEGKSPTEAWISNQIILSDEVKQANEDFLHAQSEVNMMAISKETLEHRKFALGVLTELYKGQYFVARSRTNTSYKDKVSDEGRRAQEEKLNSQPRARRRTTGE